jgi:hypothetical protein
MGESDQKVGLISQAALHRLLLSSCGWPLIQTASGLRRLSKICFSYALVGAEPVINDQPFKANTTLNPDRFKSERNAPRDAS